MPFYVLLRLLLRLDLDVRTGEVYNEQLDNLMCFCPIYSDAGC